MIRKATRKTKFLRALEERRDGMKRGEIKDLLRSLARSQGMYGRLLRDIESMDKVDQEDFWSELEAQNFKDDLDVIMYFEA